MIYCDRQGRPITLLEAALKGSDYRVVERVTLPNGWLVSTVWLTLPGPQPVFESMVFAPAGVDVADWESYGCERCERYSTESEAREGHKSMAAKWAVLPPPLRAGEARP